MRVLVTAASQHGATQAIAHEIARQLRAAGHTAYALDPVEVDDLDGVDAVVIGSAVYHGRWMPEARNLVARLRDQLGGRPVWLFSSGPVGDPLRPTAETADAASIAQQTHALDHHLFAGRIDESTLSRTERVRVRRLHAADGDYRDWDEIRSWTEELVFQLATQPSPSNGSVMEPARNDVS
jgi:menaquinone-dependent protoporphyrinogen oxidase